MQPTDLSTYLHPLPQYSLLHITGPDATQFLQGQLTQDVIQLTETLSLPAACCNPKGRVIATLRLVKFDDEDAGYYLIVHSSLAKTFIQHLEKYAKFSNVTIRTENTNVLCGMMLSHDEASALQFPETQNKVSKFDAQLIINLDAKQHCYIVIRDAQSFSSDTNDFQTQWQHAQYLRGEVDVTEALTGQFTPQQIGLEQLGALDFKKGCYTGQEIIARTHYLGKLKNHLYQIVLDEIVELNVGDELFNEDNSSVVGTILMSHQFENKMALLANLKDAAANRESLALTKLSHIQCV